MLNKYIIGLIVALVLFGAGFYTGRGQKQVEVQEKIVERKGETITVYKDRVVTVTRVVRPDGTVEETTRTEEKEGRKEEKIVEKDKQKDTATRSNVSNYSLGLKYWTSIADIHNTGRDYRDRDRYEVTAGYRIGGDVWLQVGGKLNREVSLGVQVHF